jgi:glycosyltransferase involved in cell wall biosynthesis
MTERVLNDRVFITGRCDFHFMNLILDNIIFSLQRAGGISIYWSELIKHYIQLNQNLIFIENEKDTHNIFRQNSDLNHFKKKSDSKWPLRLKRYLDVPLFDEKNAVFHSSYFRLPQDKKIPVITTVHDFTYEKFVTGLRKRIHGFQKKRAVLNSDGVICVSENTKQDLLHYYPEYDESRVKVIYNGVSEAFFNLSEDEKKSFRETVRLDLPEYFMVYVGDRKGYKNFSMAIELLKIFPKLSLVVIGGGDWSVAEMEMMKEAYSRVSHFQGIRIEELNYIYNLAHFLIYPSHYEGFGIPVIEAMAAGCPVVAGDFSSIPEVAGDAGLLSNSMKVEEFAELILSLNDSSEYKSIVKRGLKQASKFSWRKCAEQTLDFYSRVMP